MEKAAYVILGSLAGLWLLVVLTGLVVAFPFGLLGLIGIVGIGLLVIKALKDRLGNEEDDYYANNVDQ